MTFEWALSAIKAGKKVKPGGDMDDVYIYAKDGLIRDQGGHSISLSSKALLATDWELYEEPQSINEDHQAYFTKRLDRLEYQIDKQDGRLAALETVGALKGISGGKYPFIHCIQCGGDSFVVKAGSLESVLPTLRLGRRIRRKTMRKWVPGDCMPISYSDLAETDWEVVPE